MNEYQSGSTPLLGVGGSSGPINSFRAWQYFLIFFVLALGSIYAAPNLFQPDPALEVRAVSSSSMDAGGIKSSLENLRESGEISGVKKIEITDDSVVIRMNDNESQLRAKDAVENRLNAVEQNVVIALARARTTPDWLSSLGGVPMNLGLDLFGGAHFLLQVNMDDYLDGVVSSASEAMRDALIEKRIRFIPGRDWLSEKTISIPFRSEELRDSALEALTDFSEYSLEEQESGGEFYLVYGLTEDRVSELEDRAIDQNLTSLRNRVNELGVSEPQVQRLGRSRIVVDLPGIQDSARAKEILNKFANLEFRLEALPNSRRSQTESYDYEGIPREILSRNIVTGNNVQDAQQAYDPETGQPQVNIQLDNDGGRRMNAVTKDNVGRSMAILFIEQKPRVRKKNVEGNIVEEFYSVEEKRLISVATIQSALGFNFRITGLDLREAQDLALLLRAGALAAPMYIVEERTVGAQLGDENIRSGWYSVIGGFLCVLLFMVFYYKWFGLAANFALTMNLVLLVSIMSVLGATLTLPGIAGIVLTVGMAVDANVLIFSRIREELKGRSPQKAIQAGFDRALLTITDANVTTFFVAIILLSIGSGPVRGFAVTLAVGIVTSMFSSILVTRALVNLMYGNRNLQALTL